MATLDTILAWSRRKGGSIPHVVLGTALALAACGKQAPASEVPSSESRSPPPDTTQFEAPRQMLGPEFVNAIAAHDAYELASAKLALQASHSQKIKALAGSMIADNAQSAEALSEAVKQADPTIPINPALSTEQQSQLTALRNASGEAFDRMYVDQLTTGHRKAVQALETYSTLGDRPALRAFASGQVETVRAHLRQLQSVSLP